jgi:uncharacterized protein (TIGR00106 family)
MAVMEISVVPLGQGPSISSYVADCIRILKKGKVPYELTAMGTNIQGNLKDLIKLALQMHELPFKKGVLRVATTIKIDDRETERSRSLGKEGR